MRVIRTEMYFDGLSRTLESRKPRSSTDASRGISFLWFKNESGFYPDIHNQLWYRSRFIEEDNVPAALDFILADGDGLSFGSETNYMPLHSREVEYVLGQTIILEQSPPHAEPLRKLIQSKTSISVGAFIGTASANAFGYPCLLFITVPLGIVVVGSSIGVSEAMAAGLHDRVKKMFTRY